MLWIDWLSTLWSISKRVWSFSPTTFISKTTEFSNPTATSPLPTTAMQVGRTDTLTKLFWTKSRNKWIWFLAKQTRSVFELAAKCVISTPWRSLLKLASRFSKTERPYLLATTKPHDWLWISFMFPIFKSCIPARINSWTGILDSMTSSSSN